MAKRKEPYDSSKIDLDALREDIVIDDVLAGASLRLHSTWGLFSAREVDSGSRLLVEAVADRIDEDHVLFDLGCGYGAIGLGLARRCPRGQVHLVDRDFVAVEYAQRNIEVNGLIHCRAYLSNGFSAVEPDQRFDHVLSNLPAKLGKEMLTIILRDAHERLKPGGCLSVVVVSGLRKFVQRNMEQVFGNHDRTAQNRVFTVATAIKET